jgi:hypothetical protein
MYHPPKRRSIAAFRRRGAARGASANDARGRAAVMLRSTSA